MVSAGSARTSAGGLVLAVLVPLGLAALAGYGFWLASTPTGIPGIADRAIAGWVPIILWVLAPVAGGFAWGRLAVPTRAIAAVVVGLAIGLGVGGLFWWLSLPTPCGSVLLRTPVEWLGPSALLGLLVGGSAVVAAWVTSIRAAAGPAILAAGAGVAAHVASLVVSLLLAAQPDFGPICARPG